MTAAGQQHAPDRRRRQRPVGVRVLVWLGVLQGVVLLAVAGVLIALRNDAGAASELETTQAGVLVAGIVFAGIGVARIVLAIFLRRGSELVRSMYGVVATLQVVAAVYAVVALHDVRFRSAWGFVEAAIVLWLLYGSDRTQEFFEA